MHLGPVLTQHDLILTNHFRKDPIYKYGDILGFWVNANLGLALSYLVREVASKIEKNCASTGLQENWNSRR